MYGPGNLGDEAMLVAALKSLPAERCVPWKSYVHRPMLHKIVRARPKPHLLVGGGTLIHGGDTKWLDYVEMRSEQGTQVSFFGTGIAFTQDQITNSSESYRRWCKILQRSHEIHLRGPQSVELCQQMGAEADTFGDFAFLLHRPEISVKDHFNRSESIGLNFGNCLGDQENFEDKCVTLVKQLSQSYQLVFYSVVPSDLVATQRILKRAAISENSYKIEEHYFKPDAFMSSIRNHKAFIGLKLHAAGLAMIAGVPALMIAYKPKSFDFMAPLEPKTDMLLTLPLDIHEILVKLDQLLKIPDNFIVEDKISVLAESQRNTLKRIYTDKDNN